MTNSPTIAQCPDPALDPRPELTMIFELLDVLKTPLQDRTEALLIVASNLRVMRPEPKHVRAIIDFAEDAA